MTETVTHLPESRRLIIDLEKCDQCDTCAVNCDYYDRPHAFDHGMLGLRERATFELICRQCAQASCVMACPFNAIERQDNRILKRHNLRCVSCKLCAHACPFGTIYTDMLPFYESACDACLHSLPKQPSCVGSCRQGALEFRQIDPGEDGVHVLDDHLAARSERWVRRETAP